MAILNHTTKIFTTDKINVYKEIMRHVWEEPLDYYQYLKTLGVGIQKHVTNPPNQRHMIKGF